MRFTKMHGNGNDFVIIDEFNGVLIPEEEKPKFVRAVCDRNFGVGGDGAIFVQRSTIADVRFRYFNSDGSEAAMCGNGIRCFSRYVVEEGYAKEGKLKVETLAGVLELEVWRNNGWWVRVDMGKVERGVVWGKRFDVGGDSYIVYAADVGVPHAVIFVEDLSFDIVPKARVIRYHPTFPEGTNVNFAKIEGGKIVLRTYERGVEGETLSCGTGSVAAAFVAHELGFVGERVEVLTRGGELIVELGERAKLTGSATRVFDGELRREELREI